MKRLASLGTSSTSALGTSSTSALGTSSTSRHVEVGVEHVGVERVECPSSAHEEVELERVECPSSQAGRPAWLCG